MLGFENGTAHRNAALGQGVGPIWMRDVYCDGDELSIFDCDANRFPYGCTHSYDVGVSCEGQSGNIDVISQPVDSQQNQWIWFEDAFVQKSASIAFV